MENENENDDDVDSRVSRSPRGVELHRGGSVVYQTAVEIRWKEV
jgi:hypothetical protein